MINKTRFGVIGCGQITVDKTLPAIFAASNAELVAVADLLPERRALALATQPGATVRAFDDYRELLADPGMDAVVYRLTNRNARRSGGGIHRGAETDALRKAAPTLRTLSARNRAFSESLQHDTPCRPTSEEVLSDTQFL